MIQSRKEIPTADTLRTTDPVRVMLVNANEQMQNQIQNVLHHAGVDAQLQNVAGYLHALAQIVTTSPPLVLVGLLTGQEPEALQETARALRRAAPLAKLLLIAEPSLEPSARSAVLQGFDGYLVLPLDESEFLSLLPDTLLHHQASRLSMAMAAELSAQREQREQQEQRELKIVDDAIVAEHAAETSHGSPASAPAPGTAAAAPTTEPIPQHEAPTTSDHKHAFLPGSEWLGLPLVHVQTSGQPVPDDQLGDSDLLDQMLASQDSVQTLATRMITARSQIAGVQYVTQIPAIPANHAHEPVALGTWQQGFLHAPSPATNEQLKPWAQWLARWLMLEDRQRKLWRLAMVDELTGAWNRRYSDLFLRDILARATEQRFQVTLMLFDIDDFKKYNDQFGHPAGDEILRQTARLMQSVVRPHDVVARIGGDEFAVIFWDPQGPRKLNSHHPQDVRKAAARFQQAIRDHRFPKLGAQAPGPLAISGGLASFPWDGRTPEELIQLADNMAMQAKSEGKNALRFGPGIEGS